MCAVAARTCTLQLRCILCCAWGCWWIVWRLYLRLFSPPWYSMPSPISASSTPLTNLHYNLSLLLQQWPVTLKIIISHIPCIFDYIVAHILNKVIMPSPLRGAYWKPLSAMCCVKNMAVFAQLLLPGVQYGSNCSLQDEIFIVNTVCQLLRKAFAKVWETPVALFNV